MATIVGPGIFLEAADVASFSDALVSMLADAQARNERVPERAARAIPMMAAVADAYRRAQRAQVPLGTPEFRSVDPSGSDGVEWVTSTEAARELGTSPENIRKRCHTGSLKARKEDGVWLVDRASLRRIRSA